MTYTCRYRSATVPHNIAEEVPKANKKFLVECLRVGLIDQQDDGSMVVHDWAEYQAGDPRKAARQARWRNGNVDAAVDAAVTAPRVGARAFPSRPHSNTEVVVKSECPHCGLIPGGPRRLAEHMHVSHGQPLAEVTA